MYTELSIYALIKNGLSEVAHKLWIKCPLAKWEKYENNHTQSVFTLPPSPYEPIRFLYDPPSL